MKILYIFIICLLLQQQVYGQTLDHELTNSTIDSLITPILDEINPDSIEYYMQNLEDYGSRYALLPNRFEIAGWIKEKFTRFGFSDVDLDSFKGNILPLDRIPIQVNVVATLPGSDRPDEIYILGGHYDSITRESINDPYAPAPGADDNASGTAAVLEIARVMKKNNYQPEATIKFICFASEETGSPMLGSDIYAENALNSGMNIKIMINNDMIGYSEHPVENSLVNICKYPGFQEYGDFAKQITQLYTILEPVDGPFNIGSDSVPFADRGFSTILFSEHEYNPNYHDPTDLVIHCNMNYCAEITKASCATLIGNMVMPKEVDNFTVTDKGDGSSLVLNWSANKDTDMVGYNVYVGILSNNYDTVFTTSETSLVLKDLVEGTQYYIGIAVYDSDGYESLINEKNGIPNSIPLAPVGLSEKALWHAVEINWLNNLEFDLFGYNIYRSTPSTEDTLLQLNTSVLADTFFIDTSPQNGFYHNYYISALDSSLNESLLSQPIVSRCVSLDQGILVIDETSDGDGTIYKPTDEEVDNFYENLFININQETIDLKEMEEIRLADIGAYSTIIWHGNDYLYLDISQTRRDLLKEYLDYGGNLLYTGFVPSGAFEGNLVYPADYSAGDFIYDYLKIQHVDHIFASRFSGAIPDNNYPIIYVDSIKTDSRTNYHLRNIESLTPTSEANEVYRYNTYYDTSTTQGSMRNEPVGVEYIGEDYKVIVLSFPLYYMNIEEAQNLMTHILAEKFDEISTINEYDKKIIPMDIKLSQNYPNPFNPSTKIKFTLPNPQHVKVEIYNTIGQRVESLLNKHMKAGYHEVEFNAQNLSSGIYFYRIEVGDPARRTGEFHDVKKMVLLR